MKTAKTIAIYHEKGSDSVRIEKETFEGKYFYDYMPCAAWTDAKQLAIAAEKIFRLKF